MKTLMELSAQGYLIAAVGRSNSEMININDPNKEACFSILNYSQKSNSNHVLICSSFSN